MFIIVFMNEQPLHVDFSLNIYADDATFGANGKTDLEVILLNLVMAKVNKWCKDNEMAINRVG